jgi:hypothetical protein
MDRSGCCRHRLQKQCSVVGLNDEVCWFRMNLGQTSPSPKGHGFHTFLPHPSSPGREPLEG